MHGVATTSLVLARMRYLHIGLFCPTEKLISPQLAGTSERLLDVPAIITEVRIARIRGIGRHTWHCFAGAITW